MVTVITIKNRRTLESLFAKLKNQASKDIASSTPREHSVLSYSIFGQNERNGTDPL
jgi:hypothetical protein